MNMHDRMDSEDVQIQDSWAVSATNRLERSRKIAWIVAAIATAITFMLAIALIMLMPLKTVEPYTLLVDRQTGHVEALAPLDDQMVGADEALTRSFLVQYVVARESFDIDDLEEDYRKVGLWSSGDALQRYVNLMQASNPASPLASLPVRSRVNVEVRSVSSLSNTRSLVRFTTVRSDPGAQPFVPQYWAAVIDYQFSGAEMSAQDRYINPLGFQVTRYRRDAETLPEVMEAIDSNSRAAGAP